MTQALTVQTTSLSETMQLGELLAASGFFQDSRGAAQAVVKVLAGREIGFGPIAAMTGINVIQGRVSISANLMAAAIKRSGRYDYRIKDMTPQRCEIEFRERNGDKWDVVGSSEFTAQDAQKAGTKNMDKFPRNMLFARAMSNGARWYCPDIFGGPVYTPEEMGATVDAETGEVIDAATVRIVTTEQSKQGGTEAKASNDKPAFLVEQRPWASDVAIEALRYTAENAKPTAGLPANDGKFGALIGLMDSAPFNTQIRHAFIKAIFNVDSSKDLSASQRYALVRWGKPEKVGEKWALAQEAVTEYEQIVKWIGVDDTAEATDGATDEAPPF